MRPKFDEIWITLSRLNLNEIVVYFDERFDFKSMGSLDFWTLKLMKYHVEMQGHVQKFLQNQFQLIVMQTRWCFFRRNVAEYWLILP